MSSWKQYQLGARVRILPDGGEERLALDRGTDRGADRTRAVGRPVALRVYRRRPSTELAGQFAAVGSSNHLARPLELHVEGGETVVVRELSFGPSLAEVIAAGPQGAAMVGAVLEQLLDGLAVLHRAGRAHLRLTPEAVRFDLLTGSLKVGELEEALLDPEPSPALIPRYLDPEVRVGRGGPSSDVYSAGRIGEALLRGGPPGQQTGEPPAGSDPSATALWSLLLRFQATGGTRPASAGEALDLLRALGLPKVGDASLPLSRFVRRHVGALRELRRWRAAPLPDLAADPADAASNSRTYRQTVSRSEAGWLWGVVGGGAVAAILGSVYLAAAPAHGVERGMRFVADACDGDVVHASIVNSADAAPHGFVIVELEVPPEAAVAIDGCALASLAPGQLLLAVEPGLHDLRFAVGAQVGSVRLAASRGERPRLDLATKLQPRGDSQAAESALARDLTGPGEESLDDFDPIEMGSVERVVRHLLAIDEKKVLPDAQLRAALPDAVALALDGLRAAERHLKVAEQPCDQRLTQAVDRELGHEPGGDASGEAALRKAAALLAVTRIEGPNLHLPLRTESEGLSLLGVTPSRRLLAAVARVAEDQELGSCLTQLRPEVHRLEVLTAMTLGQLPGAEEPDESSDETE